MKLAGEWVVVTGTSRGIGRATVRRLVRAGASVVAGVRSAADAETLEREGEGRVRGLALDIGDEASIAAAAERAESLAGSGGLAGLVNNAAGGGFQAPMESAPREALVGAFQVIAFGTMRLTAALMPLLRRRGGRIVNVGAGRLPIPLLGPGYGAKLAMEAMTDVLRVELRGTGVRVAIVEPGMTAWEDPAAQLASYREETERSLEHAPSADRARYARAVERTLAMHRRMMKTAAPADRVAATIERALAARRPRARYYCGWEQKTVAWLERLTTERVRDAIAGRSMGST